MPEITTPVTSRFTYDKMGSGPALVLIHGFPECGSLWRGVRDHLARFFTVLIPDLPGSGASTLENNGSMDDMASCIRYMLEAEGHSRAVLAGHSMGGYVALAFAVLWPGMVAGISLVHSTPAADDEEKVRTRLRSIELIQNGGRQAFVNQLIPNLFSPVFKQEHPDAVKRQTNEAMQIGPESLVIYYRAMIARKDTTDMLKKAPYPVQWILGLDDNIIPYKKLLTICYQSGINFVSIYQNCGHMGMIECPGPLAADLQLFAQYASNHHPDQL